MRNKILYIKYSELTLKKKNRNEFIKSLVRNVKNALKDFDYELKYTYDFIKIYNFKNDKEIINILKFIPGIQYLTEAYEYGINDFQLLKSEIFETCNFEGFETFKVESKRSFKEFELTSVDIKLQLAAVILKNKEIKVDVKNPELLINIEVSKENIIIFTNKIICEKGLPIGSNGRVLMLLSGGIDSPIAAKLLMKRGLKVDFLTFITPPHTSEKALDKVKKIASHITMNEKLQNNKLFICNFSTLQDEIRHIEKESYRITLMRRYFFRIAKEISIKYGYDAIATGESLGQVASQTIESMQVINSSIDNYLVLRPLVAINKEDIITMSRKYGLYDLSILPYDDSCSLFAPKKPTTKPKLETAIKLEESLDFVETVFNNTLENKIEVFRGVFDEDI